MAEGKLIELKNGGSGKQLNGNQVAKNAGQSFETFLLERR